AKGASGYDRPVPARRKQLQRQRGTIDHFTPTTAILGFVDPGLPEIHRFLESFGDSAVEAAGGSFVRVSLLENEGRGLAGPQREFRYRRAIDDPDRTLATQPQRRPVRTFPDA